MGKARILLADDHAVLRAGLRMLLNAEPDLEVVGEASNTAQTVALAQELEPDLVLLDMRMPGGGGLEATRRILAAQPRVRILILSMYDDQGYLHQVLEAGASGYTLKRAADTELLSAIRAVLRGEIYLDPALAKVLVEELLDKNVPDPLRARKKPDVLSEREREVLSLIAQGYTNQQVADRLYLSVKTVETYKSRLMDKLNLRGRVALVRYALEHRLLSEEDFEPGVS